MYIILPTSLQDRELHTYGMYSQVLVHGVLKLACSSDMLPEQSRSPALLSKLMRLFAAM